MNIRTYSLGELQTNCYFLLIDSHCLIIDPGDSAEFLLEEISRQNLTVDAILLTHGHFDHCMAAGEIQLSLDIPVFLHSKDIFLINRLEETAKHFLQHTPIVLKPTIQTVKNGKKILENFTFEVIETPGHTPGGVSYFFKDESAIFSGDVVFQEGVGDYSHSYSNKYDLFHSIKYIKSLNTIIYPGHGVSF
jgi:glyoxylase-like metal-dependent hydrolase (beta-lactamase superfamily II)